MALNAQGYFNCLKSYLNTDHYGQVVTESDGFSLKEKVFGKSGPRPKEYKVRFRFQGEVIILKLDTKKNGSTPPLFHFLDDNAKPWSKRCDFVVFNLRRNRIFVYCFEFKSESIPHDVPDQLKASVDWIKSLHSTIKAYTNNKSKMNVMKFVLSEHPDPSVYLDADDKYLQRDHTIRHYHYQDLTDMSLADLENTNIEEVR
ncbi:hypothetical protein LCL99_09730 [Halomonas denitrificans]|uniref:hypothetical protein n=1 Tax=Halomonas denitrificans TaxID=370769 RepID=UPI001CD67F4E|nr:hypothetical protein [Halomonas denitrificans]MCA0974752.1 hypothetical protein [Halomonas denitrificans]